jgi:hypothetical protein
MDLSPHVDAMYFYSGFSNTHLAGTLLVQPAGELGKLLTQAGEYVYGQSQPGLFSKAGNCSSTRLC